MVGPYRWMQIIVWVTACGPPVDSCLFWSYGWYRSYKQLSVCDLQERILVADIMAVAGWSRELLTTKTCFSDF